MTRNEEQIAYWNGAVGEVWAAMQVQLDTQLAPLGRAALGALMLRAGERVIDVGCGAGQTTIELRERVGSGGQAVGVDVSEPLLALARSRAPDATFVAADAQTYAFEAGRFDAVYSRFGVMFFADPVAAFANLVQALRPGGRLAFVCWRRLEDNPIMTVPLAAAVAAGAPAPVSGPPDAPGPFAFADRQRVVGILEAAGFTEVAHAAHDEAVGGNDLEAALALALHVGPLARMLRDAPAHREAAVTAVRAALAAYVVDGRMMMPSATWIVTATRP
jgi:SAM-dependent methyltransferase